MSKCKRTNNISIFNDVKKNTAQNISNRAPELIRAQKKQALWSQKQHYNWNSKGIENKIKMDK